MNKKEKIPDLIDFANYFTKVKTPTPLYISTSIRRKIMLNSEWFPFFIFNGCAWEPVFKNLKGGVWELTVKKKEYNNAEN